MGIFNFFKRTPKSKLLFSEIEVDMHSHLVPGIDDGVKTIEESLAVIQQMADLGYRKLITTPHINFDYYPNSKEIILNAFEPVKEAVEKSGLNIEMEVAAEYFVDEHFYTLLNKKEILTIKGNYVLIEFPFMHEPMNVQHVLFDLQSNGYIPIVAHFERYMYWHEKFDMVYQLKEWGAKIQMNLNSISGHYNKEIRIQAEKLIKSGVIDFVASDCHRIEHIHLMKKLPENSIFHRIKEGNILLNSYL